MALLLGIAALGGAAPAAAQEIRGRVLPPHADATTLALAWLEGRYRMPVVCAAGDGPSVPGALRVAARRAPLEGPEPAVRVTFYGLPERPEGGGAERCSNLLERDVPDLRGVLRVTYRSAGRADLGEADFRRTLRGGSVRYAILDGTLVLRRADSDTEERHRLEGGWLEVRALRPGSDGLRMLVGMLGRLPAQARAFELRIETEDGPLWKGFFVEEAR